MSCYSLDLREKVIESLKNKNSIRKVALIFGISSKTVFNWKKRNEIGELKPKDNLIRKAKKVNQIVLEEYIKNNPDKTLQAVADYFNVHKSAIFARVKKAKITYKKKSSAIKKEIKLQEKII